MYRNIFGGEALLTATYLINCMPSRVLSFNTPERCLLQFYPVSKMLYTLPYKVFGCVVYVLVPSHLRTKLDRKTVRCVFVGYSNNQKGYKCYCPVTKKMFVSLNVVFDEQSAYYPVNNICPYTDTNLSNYWSIIDVVRSNPSSQSQGADSALKHCSPGSNEQDNAEPSAPRVVVTRPPIHQVYSRRNSNTEGLKFLSTDKETGNIPSNLSDNLPIALRKGTRECTKHPLYTFLAYDRLGSTFNTFTCNLEREYIPSCVDEALKNPHW